MKLHVQFLSGGDGGGRKGNSYNGGGPEVFMLSIKKKEEINICLSTPDGPKRCAQLLPMVSYGGDETNMYRRRKISLGLDMRCELLRYCSGRKMSGMRASGGGEGISVAWYAVLDVIQIGLERSGGRSQNLVRLTDRIVWEKSSSRGNIRGRRGGGWGGGCKIKGLSSLSPQIVWFFSGYDN